MKTDAAAGLLSRMGDIPMADAEGRSRWTMQGIQPEAVVFPRTVEELAEVLGRCSEEGWIVVPAGAGGWADGGGPFPRPDLVVSMREMRAITEYEPDDLTLTAEAGVTLQAVDRRTRKHGQWLAQDPPMWRDTTLGAFVATGLPGPLVAGFGRPRDHVLGLTAVTGDGRIIRPGGKVVKNVAGYDLVRLLTGSWGTLAVIAAATIRLFPRPRHEVTLLFRASELSDLVQVARALATAPVVPEALELVWPPFDPGGGATAPEGADRGGPGGAVAARLQGSREAVEEKARLLQEAVAAGWSGGSSGGSSARGSASAAADSAAGSPSRSRSELPGGFVAERLEDEASGAFHDRLAEAGVGSSLSLRLSLLPSRLDALMEAGQALRARCEGEGGRAWMSASVTRGTLRLELDPEPAGESAGESDETKGFPPSIWEAELTRIRERLETKGGDLTILRGPRPLLESIGSRGSMGGSSTLMERIERALDPAGILVPGRMNPGPQGNGDRTHA